MTGPRAYQEITLTHESHAVRLVPSLRAASYLERLHDGFPALLDKIRQFDTRTIAAIITAFAADKEAAQALFLHAATQPLSDFKEAAQGSVIALIAALLPTATEAPGTPGATPGTPATPQPWAEVFAELFGLATGWLGWTPAAAWQATPQEITDAFAAHVEKLKAIHGAGDADQDAAGNSEIYTPERHAQIVEQGFDPAFDRAGLADLKAMSASREGQIT